MGGCTCCLTAGPRPPPLCPCRTCGCKGCRRGRHTCGCRTCGTGGSHGTPGSWVACCRQAPPPAGLPSRPQAPPHTDRPSRFRRKSGFSPPTPPHPTTQGRHTTHSVGGRLLAPCRPPAARTPAARLPQAAAAPRDPLARNIPGPAPPHPAHPPATGKPPQRQCPSSCNPSACPSPL